MTSDILRKKSDVPSQKKDICMSADEEEMKPNFGTASFYVNPDRG